MKNKNTAQLDNLFSPKSIAVIGVSENTAKLGSVIYSNILKAGFEGNVFPVNPKYPELYGKKCFPSVSKIPSEVDVAVVVIPAEFVFEAVKDCAEKKVKDLIIISAGFGETGEDGQKLEREITEYARQNNMRLLGPNCLGLIVPSTKLNASFAPQIPENGDIAFLSQSGAFNTAILDLAEQNNLGFSHFISIGNKSDLNELDFAQNLLYDNKVKVMGIYLEEFEDGKDFADIIKNSPEKLIVLLHPGESTEAQKAISSHTGSLAGSSDAIKAGLRQAGVIQVNTIEKMFASMMMCSWGRLPKSGKVAIVTNAGGPGIMVTDMVARAGLKLANLSAETQEELKKVLPITASVHNPVDLIGDAPAQRYYDAIRILEKDPEADIIIILLTPQLVTQIEETAKLIIDFYSASSKLLVPIFIGGKYVQAGLSRFYDQKVPAFQYPEEALDSINNLVFYSKYLKTKSEKPSINKLKGSYKQEINKLITDQPFPLPQEIAKKLAEEAGLDMPKEKLVHNIEEAIDFAEIANYPVVLKALAEDIIHKTDVKALFLNINNQQMLKDSYHKLIDNIAKATHKFPKQVLIQEQIHGGEELFIGANRDGDAEVYNHGKGFGHLIVFGKGGIYTEVYKDIANGLAPLTKTQIEEMILHTKVSKIIMGTRGQKKLAYEELIKTLEKIQNMLLSYPEIVSVDINPLILTKERSIIVDLKAFIQK